MAIATKKITYDEFMALPDDNPYLELIDGEIVDRFAHEGEYDVPAPELEHQDALYKLALLLARFVQQRGGKAYFAPTDVKFDEENTPQPDIFWIAPDGKCRPNDKTNSKVHLILLQKCYHGEPRNGIDARNMNFTKSMVSGNIGLLILSSS